MGTSAKASQAWQHLSVNADKHQFWAFAETHVSADAVRQGHKEAQAIGMKLIANSARPPGQAQSQEMEARANEGGEWPLAAGHREVPALAAAQHRGFRARQSGVNDGFCAAP
eukprot:4216323-Pyramimonas_sp.AAC.1